MNKFYQIIAFLFLTAPLAAQTFTWQNAPVTINDISLANPWAGGLNSPQWSAVDLNNDEKLDLYIFERGANVHLTFLNVGNDGESKYVFAPQYAANFPYCEFWALLRDYNRDGKMDIFACAADEGIPGIKVYTGAFQNNELVFERYEVGDFFDVITVPSSGELTNLLVNYPDLPAIDDLDGDGDLDVLALNSGISAVHYFENLAIENGYTDDTLLFKLKDECWGKFAIGQLVQSLNLSPSPTECAPGFAPPGEIEERGNLHGGATLCTFDEDNDGDKELLLGDLLYENVIRAKNSGTPEEAYVMEQDTFYPSYDNSVELDLFPGCFYLDLDNDGNRDLIVSPNETKTAQDVNCAWFYKNVQTDELPVFEQLQKNFLVGGMIDLGSGAAPAFFDYNADGLMDFVVGNGDRYTGDFSVKDAFLQLFENTGTPTEPKFELVNANWLNFNQFSSIEQPPYAFSPTFGDMDSDGDLDLLVGERYGTIFFVQNNGGAGNPVNFGSIQPFWKDIVVGSHSTPFVADLNKDGLPDLVIGERQGNVNFLPNIGAIGNPAFHPDADEAPNNKDFGNVSTRQPGYSTGYSAPMVLDFPNVSYLLSGSELGYIEMYVINPDSLAGGTFDVFDETLGGLRLGRETHLSMVNLDGDMFLDALIGNSRGGVGLFGSPITIEGTVGSKEALPSLEVNIFPNPAGQQLWVKLPPNTPAFEYKVMNALGQLVATGKISGAAAEIETGAFAAGIYFLEIRAGKAVATKRFVKSFH